MFDFLNNDAVVIVLNIIFLVLIIYDYKKYQQTKQKVLLLNIAVTIGFAIWVMIPFYNKYLTWKPQNIASLAAASKEHNNTLRDCLIDKTIKAYSYESYCRQDLNGTEFKAFLSETLKACQED